MNPIASFKKKIRSITNLKVKAVGVLMIWVPVAGHDRALHVEIPIRRESHFGPRGARGIERLIHRTEKVTECVAQWFHEPGAAVFLIAVKVQASQLPHSDPYFVVEK